MNYTDLIFTPGPVRMFDYTLELGAKQTPYFRTGEFSKVILECEKNLIEIFNAPKGSRVIFLAGSGTAAMEASICNFLNFNDKAFVVNGGGFGQRFVDICKLKKINFQEYKVVNNSNRFDDVIIDKNITSFLINGHETSIGLLYDLYSVGKLCRENGLLNIVDGISMVITDEIDMIEQKIDVLIASSNKGLALPPGLAIIVMNERAIGRLKEADSLYFNFRNYLSNGLRGQTPFTPPVTIILQLHERLRKIMVTSVKEEIKRTKIIAEYFRNKISNLPLKFYVENMPNAMTTLEVEKNIEVEELIDYLWVKHKISVCPNGGELKNRIFRVSHMGNMDKKCIDILVDALSDFYKEKK